MWVFSGFVSEVDAGLIVTVTDNNLSEHEDSELNVGVAFFMVALLNVLCLYRIL